ncbi:NACHT, LRR and PYD domains-containing protein 12-like [Scleropages formosus]|uniref:NACHT, LRR and PYD domains-containing protein 12-like n=1 Tax=Scleropages formosus TaxID=113540 RepID=A0A0P7TX05_SCLFO|nr:NACHT, LRR and PYD domains-containing protein 12-like [Scleropages formosus]
MDFLLTSQQKLKSHLKKLFECIFEGTAKHGNRTPLNDIYTELYITESSTGGISNEHEVRHIERALNKPAVQETKIKCMDIFTPLPGEVTHIRTVLTQGIAGIGKTVSVQKFILDWAEGKENQEINLIFSLAFRDLNLLKNKQFSLTQLVHYFLPEFKEFELTQHLNSKVLFVFDGLDECHLPLDFKNNEVWSDVNKDNLPGSTVLERLFVEEHSEEIPKTLTEMYTHFLIFQTSLKNLNDSNLLKRTVDQALESKNGHLDLYLRFLLGLSMEYNQDLLNGLLTQAGRTLHNNEKIVHYIYKKINENLSPEKTIYLFHCLNELNDNSLVKEVQNYLNAGRLAEKNMNPTDWSALAFVLMMSAEELEELDLRNCALNDKGLQRMLPVIQVSRTALVNRCSLTERCCEGLASILSSDSNLRVLDLSDNDLQDSGVKILSAGLGNQQCKLEILRLNRCSLTERCFEVLASILNSDSNLRELDLSDNDLRDSGVELLSAGLGNKRCKLDTLRLNRCSLTEGCYGVLTSVLSSDSNLRVLDLSDSDLRDSGVELLSNGLGNKQCKLDTLRLNRCSLTERGCEDLASVLSSDLNLRVLGLSDNDLQDSGVQLLCYGLGNQKCKLDTLKLSGCCVTERGCTSLASALHLNPCSHLRELDLSYNHPGDSRVKLLSDLLEDPHLWTMVDSIGSDQDSSNPAL